MNAQTETPAGENGKKGILAPERRRGLFVGLIAAIVVIGGGYWLYDRLIASRSVTTDNAYVQAENAQITPLTAGQVVEVPVANTAIVKKGQIVLRLDDADQQIAYAQAQADLAAVRRKYAQTLAQGAALGASADAQQAAVAQAQATLSAARADLAKARVDYDRRASLKSTGAVSGDEVTAVTNGLNTAQANVRKASASLAQAIAAQRSARSNQAATLALTRGTTVDSAPEVMQAEARLRQAKLNLDRTVIRAPVDGVIAKQSVQVGQLVSQGMVTMIVVPVEQLYVDANFKENQLGKVRPGQSATLTSDLYGGDVVYHGRVVGFAGGTGAAFALIPAQNATGNWIKVVQRLPVRIALDPKELREHPLRVGLSMKAKIDLAGAN